MLESDPDIEVVGAAPDPRVARQKIKELNPDVLTLDIEMPHMDGLAFLEKIMTLRPMPVVMVSSLTQHGADATLRALELGAVDFVAKPARNIEGSLSEQRAELISKVKMAARARVERRTSPLPPDLRRISRPAGYSSTEKIIAIGASTGGVEALTKILCAMPADSPAILVTQHMPAQFTASFAKRLDGHCAISVAEAVDGVRILPGHAYIAPGNLHLELGRSGANYTNVVRRSDRVNGHCPSVDVLFHSVATSAGANAIGVILTGMGKDGANGLLAMRQTGALTLGQDEASCVVYSMPRAAQNIGAIEAELPLNDLASGILKRCTSSRGKTMRI
jgi:two-component system, chemotaxis family, protein-glutamate methylesterase/glutaminase